METLSRISYRPYNCNPAQNYVNRTYTAIGDNVFVKNSRLYAIVMPHVAGSRRSRKTLFQAKIMRVTHD